MLTAILKTAGVFGLSVLAPAVAGEDAPGRQTESMVFSCYTCHGTDGRSPGAMPSIDGKSSAYIVRKLSEFQRGQGDPTIMNRVAKGFTEEEIHRIAEYISSED